MLESALRWRGIWAAITCISVVGLGLSLSIPLLSLMMEARGVSDAMIGLNTAVAGLAALCMAPLVPRLVLRVGTANALYMALALGFASFLLFPPTPFWAWFPLRFLFACSITVLFVVSEFWISAIAPDGRRGFIMGIYGTVLSLGFAIGPAVLAVFGSDSYIPFAITVAALAAAAIPVALGGSIAPKVEARPRFRFLALLMVAPSATLAAFVFGADESTMFAFLALYGIRSGLEESAAALLVTMVGLGSLFSQIPLGIMADRMNKTLALALCGLAGGLAVLALPFVVGTPWLAFATVFVWGGITGGLYTIGLTHLGARFSGSDLASANALFVMLYSLGMLVGPTVAGGAMDFWGPPGLPVFIAILLGAYTVVAGYRWLSQKG